MIKIDLNKGEEVVYIDEPQHTLLDALASQGVEAEAQCKDGFCGSCKCRLTEGDVEYTQTALAFVMDDEILPCVCKPLTSIKLEQVNYRLNDRKIDKPSN